MPAHINIYTPCVQHKYYNILVYFYKYNICVYINMVIITAAFASSDPAMNNRVKTIRTSAHVYTLQRDAAVHTHYTVYTLTHSRSHGQWIDGH